MTSWVHAVASAHPDVASASLKELDFFSYRFDHGYRWYEEQFPSAGRDAIAFEVSPSYFHDPRAPARVAAYRPDMRVIAILRDPVARAYSNHLHEVMKGHVPICAFAEGLANNPAYVEQGLYATHLARWLDHFPAERVLCLIAEEVVRDPRGAAERMYGFLGIRADYRPGVLDERRNESDRARSPLLRAALRAGGEAMRRARLEETLVRVKKLPGVSQILRYNSVQMRREVPPMTTDDVERLRTLFASETLGIATLLGREALPWDTWRYAAGRA
jgi:hypothetical protein